jgi:hypothetical protein
MKTKQAVVLDSFNQPWALAEVPEDMRGGEQTMGDDSRRLTTRRD